MVDCKVSILLSPRTYGLIIRGRPGPYISEFLSLNLCYLQTNWQMVKLLEEVSRAGLEMLQEIWGPIMWIIKMVCFALTVGQAVTQPE